MDHTGGITSDPSIHWSALPWPARAFRIAHVTWGVAGMGSLAYVWWCALVDRRDRALAASIAFLGLEGVALLVGRGDCPFGAFQRRLGDPVPMFELVLPPRAANAAVPALTGIAAAGFAIVGLRALARSDLRRPAASRR